MIAKINIGYETSWREMADDLRTGTENYALNSGSIVDARLTDGRVIEFKVCRDERGKVFFLSNNITFRHRMNERDTNAGGWRDSEMRSYLQDEIYPLLSDELRSVIQPTRIVQVLNGERIETLDKLFIPSRTQMFGIGDYSDAEPEDTQLDIFHCNLDRVKARGGDPCWYWLRSPALGYTTYFMFVNNGGNLYYYTGASSNYGVCLGFSIEENEILF